MTPSAKMAELVDSVKMYVAEKESDWVGVDLLYSSMVHTDGYINLDIWATCKHQASDTMLAYYAKSNLILFLHTYMQSASIDFIKPILPCTTLPELPVSMRKYEQPPLASPAGPPGDAANLSDISRSSGRRG
eukprot:720214-Pleurochrysis_carterae.AAC.1